MAALPPTVCTSCTTKASACRLARVRSGSVTASGVRLSTASDGASTGRTCRRAVRVLRTTGGGTVAGACGLRATLPCLADGRGRRTLGQAGLALSRLSPFRTLLASSER